MTRDTTDLAGVRHDRYETLGSTNAEALARARAGERGPLWISAAMQTGGRGRRGKSWVSPPGNLYATLLLTEPSPPALAPQLSFVTGLAVHDAVVACAPDLAERVKLKWPNDLLLDGRKLAGLLIEAESQPLFSVAIGIGVNCVSHPADTGYGATDLQANGVSAAMDDLLANLAAAMNVRLAQWAAGAGFASIRNDWLDRAASLGETIMVRLPERQLTGVFEGIDADGRLLIATPDNATETIAAGDVFALGTQ
ncbi:MAG TPA: biotin--[acetyl-CoA-carboxylase] ligase [Reyranella sp.]|nr:biotin--[acetyl-CoA-carboxylase] ligase [Reyranella sp.]